jgi:hypothetical protein
VEAHQELGYQLEARALPHRRESLLLHPRSFSRAAPNGEHEDDDPRAEESSREGEDHEHRSAIVRPSGVTIEDVQRAIWRGERAASHDQGDRCWQREAMRQVVKRYDCDERRYCCNRRRRDR